MQIKDIPNIITMGRMLLIVPIVMLLVNNLLIESLVLFVVAGASDGLDGFLAKKYNWQSDLGALLDPIADKFMIISVFISCVYIEIIPLWLAIIVILRDLVIILGGIYYDKIINHIGTMKPSIVSKINTFVQIFLILIVIFNNINPIISAYWLNAIFYVVLTTTVLSGADYVWTWGLKAWKIKHELPGNES